MVERGSFMQEFVAGNFGGIMGIAVVYPFDTLKIRMQTHPTYKNMLDVYKHMTKSDGVLALYRGLLSPTLGFGCCFAVAFSAYGHGCRTIADYKRIHIDNLSLIDMSLAGAYTGVMQSPVRQIVERVKSVMQVRERSGHSPYKWSGACAWDLIKREGLARGLFQGMSSLTLREIAQFSVYYPCYEICKRGTSQIVSERKWQCFIAGGVTGVVQWLPPILFLDAIKSKMQTVEPGVYKGVSDCALKMYKEGGLRVFFRGFVPAMLRAFPLHGIIFLGYDYVICKLNA